jgi:magnesium-transporting ATPase (P-type)
VRRRLPNAIRGLDAQAATERRVRFGPNTLPEEKPVGVSALIASQFRDALVMLLLAGIVNAALGAVQEGRVGFQLS